MNHQGDGSRRDEDQWWAELYADHEPDSGPADRKDDTVDDRFGSAVRLLEREPEPTPGQDPEREGPAGPAGPPWWTPAPRLPAGAIPSPRRTPSPGPGSAPAPVVDAPSGAGSGALLPEVHDLPEAHDSADPAADFVGDRPPTYDADPTAWPETDPDHIGDPVPDTVADGARYGVLTLRAVSVRGDSARYRGRPRGDALLTARFGEGDEALLLLAVARGDRVAQDAHRAAHDAVRWITEAVGRSGQRLGEDLRAGRRASLKSGLHRLTDRCLGRLRARGEDLGLAPEEYAAELRCLLLPADPACRTRVFFGVGGGGGLFRLRDGRWQDLDPSAGTGEAAGGLAEPDGFHPAADRDTVRPVHFRFRASVGRPGDTLLLCSRGLAEPLREEPAFAHHLAQRWEGRRPPGLAAFLRDAQLRAKGHCGDRTAVAAWEQ